MSTPKLPADYWHTFVYVHFSWLACGQCKKEPDLEWAWQGIIAEGEAGVQQFTDRVVPHLKSAGWIFHDAEPCCPECAAMQGFTDESISN
jgi:hypothetical protein